MVIISKADSGINRAIKDIIDGFVIAVIIRSILGAYNLYFLVVIFDIASIIAIIYLFEKMKYWSILYSIGWIIGVLLFISILSPNEVILYVVIFVIVIYLKISRKIKGK